MKKVIVTVFLSILAAVNACTVWIIAPDSTQSGGYIIHKTRDRSIWRKLQTRLRWLPEEEGKFRVAIIPYTYELTNFHNLKVGDKVNLEFDIIGKYIQKIAAAYLKR